VVDGRIFLSPKKELFLIISTVCIKKLKLALLQAIVNVLIVENFLNIQPGHLTVIEVFYLWPANLYIGKAQI